jgi:monofunctional biosynthetic peptidoglycan transglycosylase
VARPPNSSKIGNKIPSKSQGIRRPALLRWLVRTLLLVPLAYVVLCLTFLQALIWLDPWFTMVHAQRRVESWWSRSAYVKRYTFVPLEKISPHLQHAVIAAEDGRFYQHRGIDFAELEKVVQEAQETGEVTRGASTISMQLIKNLFLTTHRNPLRKPVEWVLVFPAEIILGKQRILELYLNVAEWGPGVYGAEAAARYHFRTSAAALDRDQAARLAAILPAPRTRRPARMHQYSAIIQNRMKRMGW